MSKTSGQIIRETVPRYEGALRRELANDPDAEHGQFRSSRTP
jgi:hypothetical protein